MCGLVGFFYTDPIRKAEVEVVRKMAQALKHRGPNDGGEFVDGNLALAHRRLSIVDLSSRGRQPLCNEDGSIWVVFNGEIYNHLDLRERLQSRGHQFQTMTDTEVLVHAYEEWGTSCFNELDAMMAVAIYNRIQGRLILATDPFGKKPIYYTMQDGIFAFGSEIKALKEHPLIQCKVSSISIGRYFAYEYIPSSSTFYEEMFKLEPGSFLEISLLEETSRSLNCRRYWNLSFEPKVELSLEGASKRFRELLIKSVEKRLMADVPLGLFLSGGMDSAAILWAISEVREAGTLSTFSIGFEEKSFDESRYSSLVANHFGTKHHHKVLRVGSLLKVLPRVLGHLDEPLGDPSLLPTYLLSEFASEYVTVALSGDGGDELLGGYDPFVAQKLAAFVEHLPARVVESFRGLVGRLPHSSRYMSMDFRLKRFLSGFSPDCRKKVELRNQIWIGSYQDRIFSKAYLKKFPLQTIFEPTLSKVDESLGDVDRLSSIYIRTYLLDDILAKVDRASMMNSLEVRSPFLDRNLAEFLARLPAHFKVHGFRRKYLLRKSLKGLIPNEILNRSKQGFSMPLTKWFKNELKISAKESCEWLAAKHPEIFAPDGLIQIFQEHTSGRTDGRKELWCAMILHHILLREERL